MAGSLRFFLSTLVIFSHLSGMPNVDHLGYYAVRSFFVLSGVVLTKSLHETYQFNFLPYYSNRLLRIIPLYLFVCGMTIVVIRAFPEQAGDFMPRWSFEENASAMLQNFLLLPLAAGYLKLRYIEPAWSLAVEMVMYVLLWLGMSRNQKLAIFCLIFGTTFHVVLVANGADFAIRYFSLASAIFSYSVGALVFYYYDRLANNARIGVTAAVLWLCNSIFGHYIWGEHVLDTGFYANSVFFAFAVPFLLELKLTKRLRAHDTILGHLSYPIFLVQWLAGFVVYLALDGYEGRGVLVFYVAMPLAVVMAALLTKLNAALIEPIRERVRDNLAQVQDADRPTARETQVEAAR